MVDFIVKNYVIIMVVAGFLIFALIGFAVDTAKNKKNKESELLTEPNEEPVPNVQMQESVNQEREPAQTEAQVTPEDSQIPEADSVNMNTDN